jgi:hypothetical protein
VPPNVGHRLSDDGYEIFGQVIRSHRVDRAVEGDLDIEPNHRGEVAHEGEDD